MNSFRLREFRSGDRFEVAELIYASINAWYAQHAMGQRFRAGPQMTEVYCDVYFGIGSSRCVVAENQRSGRLMGSCFYHPRAGHVGLGIMNVHPNYFGFGIASALLKYICDFTDDNPYPSLRLTQSALNLDSFSLYNRAGFVPVQAYQDLKVPVPEEGLGRFVPGSDRVRNATLDDVPALVALEEELSGVSRQEDYRFCVENSLGFFHSSVYEGVSGDSKAFCSPRLTLPAICWDRA
ncbi:MAG: GNAT family N-acetyltransferase [Acidobacteriota bacterium]